MIQYCLGTTYEEAKKAIRYILKRYHKYKKLWDKQFGKRLLEYTLQDYTINLKLEISLRFYPIYKLTEVKQQVLKDFIRENLQLRRIKPSQLSASYSVLFILKKNRKLKIYINYKQLNSIIKKD